MVALELKKPKKIIIGCFSIHNVNLMVGQFTQL